MSVPKQQSAIVANLCRTLQYERTALPAAILEDLDSMAAIDAFAEKRQKIYLLFAALAGLGTFLSLPSLVVGGAFTVASLTGLTVVFGVKCAKWARLNVPNERYLVARKLIELFARDMTNQEEITLKLVLSPADQATKKVRRGFDRTYYEDSWLSIEGQFADETRFSATINELLQIKFRKAKRKPKGFEASLTLGFSRKTYGAAAGMAKDVVGAVKLPAGTGLKSVRIKDNLLKITVKLPSVVNMFGKPDPVVEKLSQAFTMMLLSSYQVLNLARILSKTSS